MDSSPNPTLLDRFIPEWHFHELHRLPVDLDPARAMAAALQVTWGEAGLARQLSRLVGNAVPADRPIVDSFGGEQGILDRTEYEVVFGTIDATRGGATPAGQRFTAERYRSFAEPGHVKIAFNFRYAAGVLSTETRVALTDRRSYRLFRLYWLLIRVGSGLTRISMLRAIRRRATTTV